MSSLDERISSTVGAKYRIVRLIAEGGMGTVYEAQHSFVRRRFAIKFLRRELSSRRDLLERFRREAETAGALENENIVAVVDFGVAEDGTPYIVMEYLQGVDLGHLLAAEGSVPSERAADLVLQAAGGVEAAHAAGLIHRDLKPQNLFVCRRSDDTDLVKVLDFGIAKLQRPEADRTRTGALLGTPAYMSPEQARGESGLDARTDVYALGVILYELLSGRTPHPGDSHNAVIHRIATQPAVPLKAGDGAVPAALVELVQRTLSMQPSERPASAAALAAELRPFARRVVWPDKVDLHRGTTIGSESTVPAAARIPPPSEHSFAGSPREPDGRQRTARKSTRPWLLAAAPVAVLLTVWWTNRPPPVPEAAPVREQPTWVEAVPAPPVPRKPTREAPVPSRSHLEGSRSNDDGAAAPRGLESEPGPGRPQSAPEPERPQSAAVRPRGRPQSSGRSGKPVASAPASAAVRATFDDRNPYQ